MSQAKPKTFNVKVAINGGKAFDGRVELHMSQNVRIPSSFRRVSKRFVGGLRDAWLLVTLTGEDVFELLDTLNTLEPVRITWSGLSGLFWVDASYTSGGRKDYVTLKAYAAGPIKGKVRAA